MNTNRYIDIEMQRMQHEILSYFRTRWKFFLAEGIFFVVLGLIAVVVPQVISVAIVLFLGWLILFGGIVQISRALMFRAMPGFWAWLFMGGLQAVVGFLFLAQPLAGVLTLTIMIAVFFALEGIAKIYLAFMLRPLPNWGWVLFSGVTALVFAVIVSISWAEASLWLLGLLFGINMIFLGASLIKMSLNYKESTH